MELAQKMQVTPVAAHRRPHKWIENIFWYILLTLMACVTVVPFLWIFLTSFKGPNDVISAIPPQFIPKDWTIDNYLRVLRMLPVGNFFANSILVGAGTTVLNVLITSLAAYPLAKMKFPGRDLIFYLLLATMIVPAQLTYIPSYVLAVKVFHYYDQIQALIFPNLATAFNIFLLRQAFRAVPNDLMDAARIDGASELRTWWNVVLPVVRPSLATTAIFTFVNSWNDFLWPSLMLPTMSHKTLPVGLMALQGAFQSDVRGVAAGVAMTVVPILIFFVALQKQFIRGLTGAVKG